MSPTIWTARQPAPRAGRKPRHKAGHGQREHPVGDPPGLRKHLEGLGGQIDHEHAQQTRPQSRARPRVCRTGLRRHGREHHKRRCTKQRMRPLPVPSTDLFDADGDRLGDRGQGNRRSCCVAVVPESHTSAVPAVVMAPIRLPAGPAGTGPRLTGRWKQWRPMPRYLTRRDVLQPSGQPAVGGKAAGTSAKIASMTPFAHSRISACCRSRRPGHDPVGRPPVGMR